MSAFSEGYETFVRLNGANFGAEHGAEYVGRVETEIKNLAKAINNPSRKIDNLSPEKLKGFVAEPWHAKTHNIDAAVKGVHAWAEAIDDNGLADIKTSWGEDFQSKINKDPLNSVRALSITNREHHNLLNQTEYAGDNPNSLYYDEQSMLVATDKMEAIQSALQRRILKNREIRPEVSNNAESVLNSLKKKIESPQGSESIPITEKEARELASLAKEGSFDPTDKDLTPESLIKPEYIMSQAFEAGLTAALISVVLKVGPEICGILCKLIQNGEVEIEDFKRVGFATIQGSTEGFVRGTVAAAITISCKSGVLGPMLKKVNPTIVGAITAITMNTIQNAFLMSVGTITRHEYANRCAQDLVVTACALGLGVAGMALASFNPITATLGYIIGSFVGSVVGSFVYKGISSCIVALSVERGSTFFGLVEQDYALPPDVLKSIGAKVFEYEKIELTTFTPQQFEMKRFEYQKFEPIKVNIKFLRRGVIGITAVGFI